MAEQPTAGAITINYLVYIVCLYYYDALTVYSMCYTMHIVW